MKIYILAILLLLGLCSSAQDKLISYEVIDSLEISELEQLANSNGIPSIFLSFNYAVDLYKLVYNTIDPLGQPTIASGALAIPRDIRCALPIASYQHGTIAKKSDIPSNYSNEAIIGLLFATDGYIVAMPDYLGLGESPGLHPYIHAESEASAVVDMLFASQELLDVFEKIYSDQLFLFGYSQGGHATVAAHQLIQQEYAADLVVTASNPMSGPYDVSGVQAEVITANTPYPTPSYLPYIIFAYQSVYGNLFDDPSDIFVAPYDDLLPDYFLGNHSTGEIDALMPSIPNAILQPEVLDSFRNDPSHRLRNVLRLNDLYNWTPECPVRLSYCTGDDQVSYLNAILARDSFVARGANDIEIMNFGNLDHFNCAEPSLISGLFWFNTFRINNNNLSIENIDITFESNTNANDGSINVAAAGGIGSLNYEWSNGSTASQIDGLAGGVYELTITDETGCSIIESIELETLVTAISMNQRNEKIKIFPNPADQIIFVKPTHFISNFAIRLIDITGKLLLTQSLVSQEISQVDISQLAPGVYELQMIGKQFFSSQKIVIY